MRSLRKSRLSRISSRNGAAAVECAIVAPLLTLFVLGAIDVGQFANIYQKVSDASREGARVAARYDTQTTSEVQAAVMDYLNDVASDELASSASVSVTDSGGNAIPNGALQTIATGSPVRVEVSVQFDPVRWISRVESLNGRQVEAKATMRRE